MALQSSGTGADKVAQGTNAQRPAGQGGMIRFNTSSNQLEFYREAPAGWNLVPTSSSLGSGKLTINGGYGVSVSITGGVYNMNKSNTTTATVSINTNDLDLRYNHTPPPPIFRMKSSASFDARGINPDYTNGHIKGGSLTRLSAGVWRFTFDSSTRPLQNNYVVVGTYGDKAGGSRRTIKINCNGSGSGLKVANMSRNSFDIAYGGVGVWGDSNNGKQGGTYQAFQVFTGS